MEPGPLSSLSVAVAQAARRAWWTDRRHQLRCVTIALFRYPAVVIPALLDYIEHVYKDGKKRSVRAACGDLCRLAADA